MLVQSTPTDEAGMPRTAAACRIPQSRTTVSADIPVCDVAGCAETDVVIGRVPVGRSGWWTRCSEHIGDLVDPGQWDEVAYW